jgi:hypothetical protein
MIYLFDDNVSQQMSKNYSIDFSIELPKYSELITHFESFDQVESFNTVLNKASLICIHESFPTTDIKSKIVANAISKKIPLIVFSGGV